MKFGDRLNYDSPARWRIRNLRYRRDLRKQGFSYRDPLIRYFGREVFHDGEIHISTLDLERRQVVLTLRNVHAVDQVVTAMTQMHRQTKRVDKRDFITQVRLKGVTRFSVSWKEPAGLMEYQCSELGKAKDLYTLHIHCRGASGQVGTVRAVFLKIEVEDIAPRLRKYVSGPMARRILALRKDEWDNPS